MEDLFYNVPVRRKALQNTAHEHAKVADMLGKYAIHNSGKSFQLQKVRHFDFIPWFQMQSENVGAEWYRDRSLTLDYDVFCSHRSLERTSGHCAGALPMVLQQSSLLILFPIILISQIGNSSTDLKTFPDASVEENIRTIYGNSVVR